MLLVVVLPAISVGMTFLFNRVVYGDDPRQHFSKKVAFVTAFFVAVAFLPASINDIQTSIRDWGICIAGRSLSCFMTEVAPTKPSELQNTIPDATNVDPIRWTIASQQPLDGRYNSDVLISQTELQLVFSCTPATLNIMLIFATEKIRSEVFSEKRDPESIMAFFNFENSKRSVPMHFVKGNPQQNGDIVYIVDWTSNDRNEIKLRDFIIQSAIENEEDFSVSIEYGSVSWESGVYNMDRVSGYWLEANSGRKGVAASNSEVCNSLATQ